MTSWNRATRDLACGPPDAQTRPRSNLPLLRRPGALRSYPQAGPRLAARASSVERLPRRGSGPNRIAHFRRSRPRIFRGKRRDVADRHKRRGGDAAPAAAGPLNTRGEGAGAAWFPPSAGPRKGTGARDEATPSGGHSLVIRGQQNGLVVRLWEWRRGCPRFSDGGVRPADRAAAERAGRRGGRSMTRRPGNPCGQSCLSGGS